MKQLVLPIMVVALAAVACRDTAAPASDVEVSMASAFSATPAGFSDLYSSYNPTGTEGAFAPAFTASGGGPGDHAFGTGGHDGHGHDGHDDFGGPGFGIGLMGGGLGGAFFGDGLGAGRFHHDSHNCAFDPSSGVTCTDTTHDGLIVTRVAKFTTADGAVQQRIDSTTNAVATSVSVHGTASRRHDAQSIVDETSTETATGLARGSTSRTVNGASKGMETTTGSSPHGAYTATRVAGDTITGVVIPSARGTSDRVYPTAGTIVRAMTVTVTIDGQSPTTRVRRELITYDGSATAKVDIMLNGTTQHCTLPLPRGHLSCQ
jgi:hypothetical protein